MKIYTQMQTVWQSNDEGDLICIHSGDPSWRQIQRSLNEFPMRVRDVAALMNIAFDMGANAKSAEIKTALGAK